MSNRTVALWSAAAALLAAALLAAAPLGAQSAVSFDIGTFGSFTRFDRSLFLDNGFGFGARAGMDFEAVGRALRLEAEVARAGSEVGGQSVVYTPSRLRLVYAMPMRDDRMRLFVGAGGVRSSYGTDTRTAVDFGLSGNAAVQLRLTERVALRVDGTVDYTSAPSNEQANMPSNWNGTLALGVSMPLAFGRRIEVVRPEPSHAPAATPAPAPAAQPAPPPAAPAVVMPPADTDRDGVPDAGDRCAGTTPGARVDLAGCPVESDTDGDAVVDGRDRCPATPPGTTVDGTGCAPLFDRTVRTITLRGVTFEPGRAELTPGSVEALDLVAAQLLENPDVRLVVAGHTDAVGSRTTNVRLSLQRAEAVRAYLVSQGVAADRLSARGYGPDKPTGSNATAAGRAMNRRVELQRVD